MNEPDFTIIGVVGVASVGFAIWLTVRIINRRERWAKRLAVATAVLLLAYPLSEGPANWLDGRGLLPNWSYRPLFGNLYVPLNELAVRTRPTSAVREWYLNLWINRANAVNPSAAPVSSGQDSN
jgi:hypothetical protein